ncbi:hypothetical protein I2I05_05985 [Hymenobacter sp. BT683]|uniref:Uncharacterized protein n=1 Tax=Hymenobacter jeongseonensis TaxID=2791027 RepID=A0ABS0IF21_9BACT|nr:hypothetical protein [Hymenobacter jeongseonensis]MBF9236940.1 hypothetical protein [Hymenobacter jeongseonensis]
MLRSVSFRLKPSSILLAAGLGAGLAQPALAQKYRTAAGVRGGGGSYGLTVQQLVLPSTTLEGLALLSARERSATVLAERHFGILGPSLNYYFGAGAHVGTHKDDGNFWGFDGIVGAEYKIPFARVVLSVDFKPTVEFNSADWTRFPTAFSVRYIILKQKNDGIQGLFEKIKTKIKGPDSD